MLRIPLVIKMRVELAPFDVMVMNVATGSIRSKFWGNAGTLTTEGSLYALVKKVEESMLGESVSMYMDADVFAGEVVGDVWRPHPAHHTYKGATASISWWRPILLHTRLLIGFGASQPAELWRLCMPQHKP
jgi:hypothetical protein